MTCKECKGTQIYQPLIGKAEPCRGCQVAHDPDLGRVSFAALRLHRVVTDFSDMQIALLKHGYSSFSPIKYRVTEHGDLVVLDGHVRVAALRYIKKHDLDAFYEILPNGLISAEEIK